MVATTTKSRKSKGRIFQQEIAGLIVKHNPEINDGDIRTALMGESGDDIVIHPDKQYLVPLSIECKRTETTSVWAWWEQAKARQTDDKIPVVIFRRSRSKPMILLTAEDFFTVLRRGVK